MVGMLVSDDDGRERACIASNRLHPFECFATGDSGIDEDASGRAFDDGSVSPAAAGQHRDRNSHARSIPGNRVETR
jgi:hypothetical protein